LLDKKTPVEPSPECRRAFFSEAFGFCDEPQQIVVTPKAVGMLRLNHAPLQAPFCAIACFAMKTRLLYQYQLTPHRGDYGLFALLRVSNN
jgi:hypothetical protein